MAGLNSLEAVKRKIQALQQQADEAEDRAQGLQRELDGERERREKVSPLPAPRPPPDPARPGPARPGAPLPALLPALPGRPPAAARARSPLSRLGPRRSPIAAPHPAGRPRRPLPPLPSSLLGRGRGRGRRVRVGRGWPSGKWGDGAEGDARSRSGERGRGTAPPSDSGLAPESGAVGIRDWTREREVRVETLSFHCLGLE